MKQQVIAEKLGITQAMVSKYLFKKERDVNDLAKKIGEKTIELIKSNSANNDISSGIMGTCLKIMQTGELCKICSEKNHLKKCNICMNIGIKADEKEKVINNLKEAVKLLEENNIVGLMPAVMMNIAMKTDNAKGKESVASIPGRIVKVNDKVKSSNAPQFNSSNHLANKLLENKEFKAIMNIKYDDKIEKAITSSGLNDILTDKGGFGIEPCAYILGKNAIDVVNKAIKINEEYEK